MKNLEMRQSILDEAHKETLEQSKYLRETWRDYMRPLKEELADLNFDLFNGSKVNDVMYHALLLYHKFVVCFFCTNSKPNL